MPFNPRRFLRAIPTKTLKQYCEANGVEVPAKLWKGSHFQVATNLAEVLVAGTDEITEGILAAFVRAETMATERGRNALFSAASDSPEIVKELAQLQSDRERAFWMITTHPALFREGEERRFFDYHSEGLRGRHYRTQPDLTVSREAADVAAFKAQLSEFHQRRDGSGASCAVEFTGRGKEGAIQITIYLQGLPNHNVEFVSGEFQRRISSPALEQAVVYEPITGETSIVAKGGAKVHEALREAFARRLLKIDPKFDGVRKRGFLLDMLKTPQPLAPDPSLGVAAVRVRRLKLAPPSIGSGALIVEAPAGAPNRSVYDLGNSWFVERSSVFRKFTVIQALISMHFAIPPGRKRAKTLNIELTKPNTSNLRDLTEADRQIAEAHIEKWKLKEPAT